MIEPQSRDNILAEWRNRALAFELEVEKAIIGQARAIRLLTISIFARGHVLLEGDVGVGKTTLLRAASRAIGGEFNRVEGTVDMMPGDLLYNAYVAPDGTPRVEPGPLARNGEQLAVFFFNEVSRARPQVQALLLRAMAERSVTAFHREVRLPHLTVFADRNRVEKEETFELATAARDRFMFEIGMAVPTDPAIRRALVFDPAFHDADALIERVASNVVPYQDLNGVAALIQREVRASDALQDYVLQLWTATQKPLDYGIRVEGTGDDLVLAGASPRGMSQLLRAARVAAWLDGRTFLVPEDVQGVFHESVAHRVFFNPVVELRRAEVAREFTHQVLQKVAAP